MLQIKEMKESYTKYAYYTHNGCYIPDWNTIILMLHENMHIARTYSTVMLQVNRHFTYQTRNIWWHYGHTLQ